MKLFLISSLLFSGGSAVAMQNETISGEVNKRFVQVKETVQKRQMKNNLLEDVKENGFPYPCEEFLSALTEEQQVAILTQIDMINASYDWPNMTDDEISEALVAARQDLNLLYEELGVEKASLAEYKAGMNEVRLEEIRENGISYVDTEKHPNLTEEQLTEINALIDELNAEYDFASMTDDELVLALTDARSEIHELFEELGIERPEGLGEQIRERIQNRIQKGYQKGFRDGYRAGNQNQNDEEIPVVDEENEGM